ncbi:MAG: glycoside hydrolase family 9 protein, partial [Chloroflexota bacterium]
DPANNGAFSFALAANADTLYILMTSVDADIITGQHGKDFWNEDSLEFYLNLSGNLAATRYSDAIYQVNINPGDMGNTDPAALTITGTNSAQATVRGSVFATADGWGFEAEVPLPFTPEHGQEIGFQAHANGSTGGDRDVKLIWSTADSADTSWQNPSVFGRGIFFEVGSSDIPLPSTAEPTAVPTVIPTATPEPTEQRFISVNQTGYFSSGVKIAVLPTENELFTTVSWSLVDAASSETVASGETLPSRPDRPSGDFVNLIDFSSFNAPGMYRLETSSAISVPFTIGDDIYGGLAVDALRYFYLNRSGIELDDAHAGAWARAAGHLSDSSVTCYSGTDQSGHEWDGCNYTVDAAGGWYDAGDYGKYVVNGGIAVWTLMNQYEFNPEAFRDDTLNIPESGSGVPDLLDEARWEMNFLLAMQVPEGQPQAGMAFHKLHALQWDGLPALPPSETNPGTPRYLMPPSTAATLNLAASAAQCARIWRSLDAEFADRCLTAAERAWQAANENPIFTYGSIPGGAVGGGDYGDGNVDDEFFWAAAELFATTGAQAYHDFLVASPHFTASGSPEQVGGISWGDVDVLGLLTLALYPDGLSADEQATVRDQIIRIADYSVELTANDGYRMAIFPNGYVWGSNSGVLNNAMVLAYAYRLTDDAKYLDAVVESMDYILGRNALNFSFVSGYGTYAMQHPHHRFWADQPDRGFPRVPPGALAGGPNAMPADPPAQAPEIAGRPPAKRYIDDIQSYSTNEVAINWNAPLAWVAAFLDAQYSE